MLKFLDWVEAQVSGQVNLLKSFMSNMAVPSLIFIAAIPRITLSYYFISVAWNLTSFIFGQDCHIRALAPAHDGQGAGNVDTTAPHYESAVWPCRLGLSL
jgi:hypothetical protein